MIHGFVQEMEELATRRERVRQNVARNSSSALISILVSDCDFAFSQSIVVLFVVLKKEEEEKNLKQGNTRKSSTIIG